ncbi:hypothetical protein JL722_6034 [Aureococcus anophagefferens]|nr:hypothetical protein JL722_6034 [Aureococcus anophagefferens]
MLGVLLLSLHSITAAPVLVLVPAANRSFAADAYAALAQALVGRGVDARVADHLPFVLAGHGDGGDAVEALGYANATVGGRSIKGVALLGACVPRAHYAAPAPNGTTPPSTRDHPAPVLTVAGSLDGVSRATRAAEAWYRQAGSDDDPVLVVEGLNHAQFADGRPLDGDLAADLEPAAAIAAVADASRLRARRAARPRRDRKVLRLADEPDVRVPAWPDASIGPAAPAPDPLPPADCTCGSPWVARAQAIMSGFEASGLANASAATKDAFEDVSDVRPFHLPHIFNACDSNDTDCVLESTTVTMPIHSLRGDYGPVAASEFRTKLKSRQAMWRRADSTRPTTTPRTRRR